MTRISHLIAPFYYLYYLILLTDKFCDQVSDAVLDACVAGDENSRVACETCCKTGMVMIFGEITTSATVNYEQVYEIVQNVMSIDANLLEHLAGKMIKALKERFHEVKSVSVRISKYNPPIKGLCHKATVELSG